jgi:hypothetical protein
MGNTERGKCPFYEYEANDVMCTIDEAMEDFFIHVY